MFQKSHKKEDLKISPTNKFQEGLNMFKFNKYYIEIIHMFKLGEFQDFHTREIHPLLLFKLSTF